MSKKSSKQPANSLEHQKQKQQQQQHKQGSGENNNNCKSNLRNQSLHNLSSEQHFGAKLDDQTSASKRKQSVVVATTQTQTLVKNHRNKGFNQKRSKMQPQQTQSELLEQSNQHQHNQEASKLDTKSTTATAISREQQQQQKEQQQKQNQKQKQNDNICAACLKPIRERYLLVALDKQWHEDCLKCACCDCRLGEVGSSLFTHADKILCRRDFLRIFGQAGNCAACKKSIPPYELVMRANENAYHMECFACQQCQYRFCVGDRFHLNEAHRIICILCHAEQQQQQQQQVQQSHQPPSHSTSYDHTPVDVQLVGATISEGANLFHCGPANESSTAASPKQAGMQQRQTEKEDPMQHSSSSQQQQPVQIKQQQPAATCAM